MCKCVLGDKRKVLFSHVDPVIIFVWLNEDYCVVIIVATRVLKCGEVEIL